jgi:proline-specific peptidase
MLLSSIFYKNRGAIMSKLTIDGLDIQLYGDDSNQSIVFIHGFPYDNTLWKNTIEKLQQEFYCITYDIRGFGNSEINSGQYTMESYVEDLENIIETLKLEEPILCGFSMGGYIALRANEKQPEKFKALILANTTTSSDNDEGKLKRAGAISSIDKNGIEPFLEKFFSVAFSEEFTQNQPQKLQELQDKITSFNPIGIKGGLLAMVSRTDTTQSLKKIDIPVLLISGEKDKVIPPDIMKKMAENIKNSTLVCLEGSGHMSMVEKPDQFNNTIKEFLETVE